MRDLAELPPVHPEVADHQRVERRDRILVELLELGEVLRVDEPVRATGPSEVHGGNPGGVASFVEVDAVGTVTVVELLDLQVGGAVADGETGHAHLGVADAAVAEPVHPGVGAVVRRGDASPPGVAAPPVLLPVVVAVSHRGELARVETLGDEDAGLLEVGFEHRDAFGRAHVAQRLTLFAVDARNRSGGHVGHGIRGVLLDRGDRVGGRRARRAGDQGVRPHADDCGGDEGRDGLPDALSHGYSLVRVVNARCVTVYNINIFI